MSEADSLSSPNEDMDISDTDSELCPDMDTSITALIRLTPYEHFTYEELKTFISERFPKWIIAKETTSKGIFHYHVVIESFSSDTRTDIQMFVYDHWPERPRGFGNKQWNFQIARDEDTGVSYALKHKDYEFAGYTQEYIEARLKESFTKSTKEGFREDFNKLKQEYADTDMDTRDFMIRFCQIKAKHNQMVNIHHAYQYAISLRIKKDQSFAEDHVEDFLYKL